jgi:hypothetical protein
MIACHSLNNMFKINIISKRKLEKISRAIGQNCLIFIAKYGN